MAQSITARLSDSDVKIIDSLVKAGMYSTRSDFLRAAARHLLREEAPEIPPLLFEAREEARRRGITIGELTGKARRIRKQLYKEMYGS